MVAPVFNSERRSRRDGDAAGMLRLLDVVAPDDRGADLSRRKDA
jgi:hypothetical protein